MSLPHARGNFPRLGILLHAPTDNALVVLRYTALKSPLIIVQEMPFVLGTEHVTEMGPGVERANANVGLCNGNQCN